MCTKAFLPAGEAAVISTPTYAMYRVHAEQRGGRVIAVPRRPANEGWALDVPAVREAGREARLVWICNPNNPTGLAEPAGAIEALLAGLEADAAADGRVAPTVVVDEAYSEFDGSSVIPLRTRFPNLVAVRTASKAYAMAGLRVGFAVAAPATLAASPSTGRRGPSAPSPRPSWPPRCATGRRCVPTWTASRGSVRASPPASRPPAGVPGRR